MTAQPVCYSLAVLLEPPGEGPGGGQSLFLTDVHVRELLLLLLLLEVLLLQAGLVPVPVQQALLHRVLTEEGPHGLPGDLPGGDLPAPAGQDGVEGLEVSGLHPHQSLQQTRLGEVLEQRGDLDIVVDVLGQLVDGAHLENILKYLEENISEIY